MEYLERVNDLQEVRQGWVEDFVDYIDRSEGTTKTYIYNLRQFFSFLRSHDIKSPSRSDIIAYREELRSRGLASNTINAYLRSTRQFFAWAEASGLYPDITNNVHGVKVDNSTHKRDALTPQEVLEVQEVLKASKAAKVEEAAKASKDTLGRTQRAEEQRLRELALYSLAVNEGLRVVEISRANIRDLEEKAGSAWLWVYGKGHSEPDQKKAVSPETAAAIREYLEARTDTKAPGSPLFVSTGNRSGGNRISSKTISAILKQALREAGFDSARLSAHSLRHSAITQALLMTNDLFAVKDFARHDNIATTQIYLHVDTDAKQAEIARNMTSYREEAAAV